MAVGVTGPATGTAWEFKKPRREGELLPGPTEAAPSWQTALGVGGFAAIASFTPSLRPRTKMDQRIITGVSAAGAVAAGFAVDALANQVDRHTKLDALESRGALAAGAGAVFLGATGAIALGRTAPVWNLIRSTALVTGFGAVTGAAMIGERAAAGRLDEHLPGGEWAAHAALLGAATAGTAAWLLKVPPVRHWGNPPPAASVDVGTAAAFRDADWSALQALRADDSVQAAVSGGAGSLLPEASLGKHGARFRSEITPAQKINELLGITDAGQPVRVYGGLEHGASIDEIVDNIFNETVRLGGFEPRRPGGPPPTVVLYLPSGSGHVNPVTVQAMEISQRGHTTGVAVQYNNQPSIMSLDKTGYSRDIYLALARRFREHIDTLPAAERPELVSSIESLGLIGVQGRKALAGRGAAGPQELGFDRALWVGTPGLSKWREQVLGRAGHTMDESGRVIEFDHPDQLAALSAEQRANLRTFFLTHHDDPVARFEPRVFYRRPDWQEQRWFPFISGLQYMVDVKNGTNSQAGLLGRVGHDYRADILPTLTKVFGNDYDEATMARITEELTQSEIARAKFPIDRPQ